MAIHVQVRLFVCYTICLSDLEGKAILEWQSVPWILAKTGNYPSNSCPYTIPLKISLSLFLFPLYLSICISVYLSSTSPLFSPLSLSIYLPSLFSLFIPSHMIHTFVQSFHPPIHPSINQSWFCHAKPRLSIVHPVWDSRIISQIISLSHKQAHSYYTKIRNVNMFLYN